MQRKCIKKFRCNSLGVSFGDRIKNSWCGLTGKQTNSAQFQNFYNYSPLYIGTLNSFFALCPFNLKSIVVPFYFRIEDVMKLFLKLLASIYRY